MAIVPPTFPPNCGQPHAITTKTATADAAASARPRPPARPRPGLPVSASRPPVPARPAGPRPDRPAVRAGRVEQRVAHPGDRDHGADGVQADPFTADPVEPAALQHRQAERRAQLQPGPGHHVQPDDQHRHQRHRARRPERVPPPRPGQRDHADHRRPRQGEPVLPDRRVRQQPPRHQAGQERPGRHRTRDGARQPPQPGPAPPPSRLAAPPHQPHPGEHGHVHQRVGPEKDRCACPSTPGRWCPGRSARGPRTPARRGRPG